MAVAAHVIDKEQAPPFLTRAYSARTWGLRDYFGMSAMELKAGYLARMSTCLSYADAIKSYKSAGGRTVEWCKQNPHAWGMVSWVLSERRKIKHGDSHQ